MRRSLSSSSRSASIRRAAPSCASSQPLRACTLQRNGRHLISSICARSSSSSPLLPMLAPSAGRRFYATAENGASSDSPATAPQPTVSPIISIQTPEEYQKLVLDASKTRPIIVDCYADWCKPCKDLTPVIEAVIKSREGKVTLAKVDIDKVSEVAVQLSVSSIPAVFAIYKKETISKFVGLKSKAELEDFVDAVLKKTQS